MAIVATSSLKALEDAINVVRKGGSVMMFGVPSKGAKLDLDMSKIYSKEILKLTNNNITKINDIISIGGMSYDSGRLNKHLKI